eukprot:gene2778-1763_t
MLCKTYRVTFGCGGILQVLAVDGLLWVCLQIICLVDNCVGLRDSVQLVRYTISELQDSCVPLGFCSLAISCGFGCILLDTLLSMIVVDCLVYVTYLCFLICVSWLCRMFNFKVQTIFVVRSLVCNLLLTLYGMIFGFGVHFVLVKCLRTVCCFAVIVNIGATYLVRLPC